MVKRILQPNFWPVRVALFAIAFMALPGLLSNTVNAYQTYRYETRPISDFYINTGIVMSDICYGDNVQSLTTTRQALGTDLGWQIDVIKTLVRHEPDGTYTEVYNVGVNAFVEASKNGFITREHAIPVREVGTYHWELQITKLYLPHSVERLDVPLIRSTDFEIKSCQ